MGNLVHLVKSGQFWSLLVIVCRLSPLLEMDSMKNIRFAWRYSISPSEGSFLYGYVEEGWQTKEKQENMKTRNGHNSTRNTLYIHQAELDDHQEVVEQLEQTKSSRVGRCLFTDRIALWLVPGVLVRRRWGMNMAGSHLLRCQGRTL